LIYAFFALIAGFVIDLIIGDPHGFPHIVRLMGAMISGLEKPLYPLKNKRNGGTALVIIMCAAWLCVPAALLFFAYKLSPWLYFALETLLLWQLTATKSLRVESDKVYKSLAAKDIEQARKWLSWIVGRDVTKLDEAGITRAAVETVAENASDAVVAPLFYTIFGGAALGYFYKAVNTMDSMIGYKNEKYIDFGRCAAKLDDVLNFIPSRFTALLMITVSGGKGLKVWRRDRFKHPSPNSAQPESACAGALGIQIGKYEPIGDATRPIEPQDIRRAHKLLYKTAFLMLIAALIARGGVLLVAL
jgi:adenosylcobinamide-phosphate synthase